MADDYAGNTTTTGAIDVGQDVTGNIDFNGDQDWFAITLTAGKRYGFRLDSAGADPLLDPLLTLYRASGNQGAQDDDSGPGSNAFLQYTAPSTGTYYLGASAYSTGGGGYQLSVIQLAPLASAGNDSLTAGSGDDSLNGLQGDDTLVGDGGNDTLVGAAGADSLQGGDGNDSLSGGAGVDTMLGGPGDDTYVVGVGDVFSENPGEGTDTIQSQGTYSLGNDFENLTLLGVLDYRGTGNALPNIITGNAGANRLLGLGGDDTIDGGDGADILSGGVGDDAYLIGAGDVVVEAAGSGTDSVLSAVDYTLARNVERLTLTGTAAHAVGNALPNEITGNVFANTLDGSAGVDTLNGGEGNDTLLGGTSADSMTGGPGDDLYGVDRSGDVVSESPGGGTDTVQTALNYTLGADLEHLTLTGALDLRGIGNVLANRIVGNDGANYLIGYGGNDTIDGSAGADTMGGGSGNDTYVVSGADQVIEIANRGNDTVLSTETYTLSANVENLTLTGSAQNGAGNGLANAITGNTAVNELAGGDGNDTLDGGAGADSLSGGAGDDTYKFDGADLVVEGIDDGTDTVVSGDAYSLADNLENLTLIGLASNGFGNAAANVIRGNDIDNELRGSGDNDTLDGGDGNDSLHGGTGDDSMTGGSGNDRYSVDSALDAVIEKPLGGLDTVLSLISHTLGAQVENLSLLGSLNLDATGNTLANHIVGNDGNNVIRGEDGNDVLEGGAGVDQLFGGNGDDTYILTDADPISEELSGGVDTVMSVASYTLGSNLENLALVGAGPTGVGNALANAITGNSTANELVGGEGNDTLDGGGGADNLSGGQGDDVLAWGMNAPIVNGGTPAPGGVDLDTLRLTGSAVLLDLTTIPNDAITDIEVIDLMNDVGNTVKLAIGDVLAISSTTDTLRVDGEAGSLQTTDGGWTQGADEVIGAHTYHSYTLLAATLLVATLLVDTHIAVTLGP